MGGSGSGSWQRWNKKNTTGDYSSLSIKRLVEEGVVKDSACKTGIWQWLRTAYGTKEVYSSIVYRVDTTDENNLYMNVSYNKNDSEQQLDYNIGLSMTRPNYGGKRWWFTCPADGCGKRVAVLYNGKYFVCRHCLNLSYESQNEILPFRLLKKSQDIHVKLGGSGCVEERINRPKGMHKKTFERQVSLMHQYHEQANLAILQKFGQMLY